jgi:hypothetical protein
MELVAPSRTISYFPCVVVKERRERERAQIEIGMRDGGVRVGG